jgi:hypothetical protein
MVAVHAEGLDSACFGDRLPEALGELLALEHHLAAEA